jgi:hypothetical protein
MMSECGSFCSPPLEGVPREDAISAYERCLAGHEPGRWPKQNKADTSSSWETLAEETIAWLQQRRPRSLGTYRTYLLQIAQLRGNPRTQSLQKWACTELTGRHPAQAPAMGSRDGGHLRPRRLRHRHGHR